MNKLRLYLTLATCLALFAAAHTQTASAQAVNQQPAANAARTYTSASPAPAAAQSTAAMDAQRAAIWNSPNMLRARAWLQDYCSKSVKVTPEEAKQYETELANMTPTQMKIYLMKFDAEEQQRQQQSAWVQQSNDATMRQALAAHRQTQ